MSQQRQVDPSLERYAKSTAAATVYFLGSAAEGFCFGRYVRIRHICIYCADEENAGFIAFLYTYNYPRTKNKSGFRLLRAEGRSLDRDVDLLVGPTDHVYLWSPDAKAAGNWWADIIYEVL